MSARFAAAMKAVGRRRSILRTIFAAPAPPPSRPTKLSDEVTSGRSGEQSETLRLYLCRALGEFAIPAAADPLITQAERVADPQTSRAAVEALAVLTTNLVAAGRAAEAPPGIVSAVVTASRSDDTSLRGAAALDTLAEMLTLEDIAPAPGSDDPAAQSQRYKRALVVINALRGVAALVDASSAPPPAMILERIEALQQDPVGDVRSSAAALLKKIERLRTAA
jgi:HEAT repeat protein